MTSKINAKFEEKLICCFKNDKNLVNFDLSNQKSKNIYTLIGPSHEKYVMFDLKKYSGLSFMKLESDAKFEEKLTCGFGKQHDEFAKFLPEYLKVGTRNWDFYGVFLSQVENV